MTSLFSILILPYIAIFFLIPLIMLIAGKIAGVVSEKLKYSRLLLIAFVGSLLGGFVRELHPYALSGVFFVVVLIMLKKQLSTSWGKALLMTVSGLIVGGTLAYGVSYFNFAGLLANNAETDNSPQVNANQTRITSQECLAISIEKAADYSEKKLDNITFSLEYPITADLPATGDGYSANCSVLYFVENSKILDVTVMNGKAESTIKPTFFSADDYSDINGLNLMDSLEILKKLKADTEFTNSLTEFLETHPDLTEKEAIRLKGITYDSINFDRYIWSASIGPLEILSAETKRLYTLDASTGEILNRGERKGFSEKWEYTDNK